MKKLIELEKQMDSYDKEFSDLLIKRNSEELFNKLLELRESDWNLYKSKFYEFYLDNVIIPEYFPDTKITNTLRKASRLFALNKPNLADNDICFGEKIINYYSSKKDIKDFIALYLELREIFDNDYCHPDDISYTAVDLLGTVEIYIINKYIKIKDSKK